MSTNYVFRASAFFQFVLAVIAVCLAFAFAISANYLHAIQYVGGFNAKPEIGLPPELFGLGSVASEFIAPVALLCALAGFRRGTVKGLVVAVICLGVMIPALAWNARSIVGATASSIDRYITQQTSDIQKRERVAQQLANLRTEMHAEQDRLTFLATQTYRRRVDRRIHAKAVDATREQIAKLRQQEGALVAELNAMKNMTAHVDAGAAAILRVLKDVNVIPNDIAASTGAQYSALLLAAFLLLTTLFGPLLLGEAMERIVVHRDELAPRHAAANGRIRGERILTRSGDIVMPPARSLKALTPMTSASLATVEVLTSEPASGVARDYATASSQPTEPTDADIRAAMRELIAAYPPIHPETIARRGERFAKMMHRHLGPEAIIPLELVKDFWAEFHKQSRLPLGPHGDLLFGLIRAGFICKANPNDPSEKVCEVPRQIVITANSLAKV